MARKVPDTSAGSILAKRVMPARLPRTFYRHITSNMGGFASTATDVNCKQRQRSPQLSA